MCGTCGCEQQPQSKVIPLERAVLSKNALLASVNRAYFAEHGITALNLMASPGAGKTTLLERTIADLAGTRDIRVIEGDQATDRDAERIRTAGGRAIQINTGTGCHLEAAMIERVLPELDAPRGGLVVIENVGNLVCPALFDLGERARVLVASVTEGDDKPIKYPTMFHACELIVLNKIDLLPHCRFDVDAFVAHVRRVTHGARVLPISATRGDGLGEWYDYLRGLA